MSAERHLLTRLNGALFSLAGLHDLVAGLDGPDHSCSHLIGDIHLLEDAAYQLILEVEGCGVTDGQ